MDYRSITSGLRLSLPVGYTPYDRSYGVYPTVMYQGYGETRDTDRARRRRVAMSL